jgi:hypothetical protein
VVAPLASVSIDVDGIGCYYRIHALGPPPPHLRGRILERGVARFLEALARRGIAATFFVVGQDALEASAASLLGAAHRAGHELASHSFTHPYELARLGERDVAGELDLADAALRAITGAPIVGFRAPGYDLSPTMLRALVERGYRYDSSIFAAPGYYVAKAAVMGLLAARRRPSGAVLTNPRALLAPPAPYRPALGAPWRRGDAPLVELPIAVTPGLRVPAIGTSLLLAPAPVRRALVASMARRPHFNFELHAIDLCDAELDELPAELVARQPDLRVPVAEKLARFDDVLARLAEGWETLPLRDVATRY